MAYEQKANEREYTDSQPEIAGCFLLPEIYNRLLEILIFSGRMRHPFSARIRILFQ